MNQHASSRGGMCGRRAGAAAVPAQQPAYRAARAPVRERAGGGVGAPHGAGLAQPGTHRLEAACMPERVPAAGCAELPACWRVAGLVCKSGRATQRARCSGPCCRWARCGGTARRTRWRGCCGRCAWTTACRPPPPSRASSTCPATSAPCWLGPATARPRCKLPGTVWDARRMATGCAALQPAQAGVSVHKECS